jgi:DNA uptake protein ComE-like DNA-binding protein
MAMISKSAKPKPVSSILSGLIVTSVFGCSLVLAGCTTEDHRQSSDDLREKTAEATAEAKRDAKSVAEGVKDGWNRDKQRVDLNNASRDELVATGLTRAQSDHVIEHRPYASAHELLTKHVLSEDEYRQIEPRVRAGEPSDSK